LAIIAFLFLLSLLPVFEVEHASVTFPAVSRASDMSVACYIVFCFSHGEEEWKGDKGAAAGHVVVQ
jgi:hypothetical protein